MFCVCQAFSVEAFDHEETFLNKGLITIIIIYLFYMRDQLCKAFFHVQTVRVFIPLRFFGNVIYLRSFQHIVMVKKIFPLVKKSNFNEI
jgi:hypothetical protein